MNEDSSPEDPRFVCRREGHLPMVTITKANGVDGPYITQCRRCGKYVEIEIPSKSADG